MINIKEVELNVTKVILTPYYYTLGKDFWLYDCKWQEQNTVQGKNVVFGGEYTIWKIMKVTDNPNLGAVYLQDQYCKYEYPDIVGNDDLTLSTKMPKCPFHIDDIVTYNPDGELDLDMFKNTESLMYQNYFSDHYATFKITGIINERYIFIKFPPLSAHSIPFPWTDFKLVIC